MAGYLDFEEAGDAIKNWISQGCSARESYLAQKYAKRWRRFTGKKTSGYVVSKVKSSTILCHYDLYGKYEGHKFEAHKFSIPKDDGWTSYLRIHRHRGEKFTDRNFPPDERALYHDPNNPRVDLQDKVQRWVRISDMFTQSEFLEFTFSVNDTLRLCGMRTLRKHQFDVLEADSDAPGKESALSSAEEICKEVFGPQKEVDYSLELLSKSTLLDQLKKHKIFEKLKQRNSPLVYSHSGQVKFKYTKKPRYLATIRVTMECILRPRGHVSFFHRGTPGEPLVKPGDVCQGALGDCYYLGALSVMSGNEDLLFDCFPDVDDTLPNPDTGAPRNEQHYNEEGIYAMAFYRNRARRIVIVDDWIPCDAQGKPVFCQIPRSTTEIWTMIAEKAYAKLNGSYENIIGGKESEALQDLMGGVPKVYYISGDQLEERWDGPTGEDNLYHFMKDLLDGGSMMGCCVGGEFVEGDLGHGIISGHAFGVLNLCELPYKGNKVRIIQIRNPWGNDTEWDGDWSDGDPKWAEIPESIKKEIGYVDAADGVWWMDFSVWKQKFSELEVCLSLKPPEWIHHHIIGKWESKTAGGNECEHLNPQFQMYVEKDCEVYIELRQPSRRPLGKPSYEVGILPLVIKDSEPGKRCVCFPQDSVLNGSPRMYHCSRSSVVNFNLKASERPYTIIPCSNTKGFESEFYMEVYTRGPSRVLPLHDDDLPICTHCNEVLDCQSYSIRTSGNDEYFHSNCHQNFQEESGPKCLHCGKPITSGTFYMLDEGEIHGSCLEPYQEANAPKCVHCQKPCFDGVFFIIGEAEDRCHAECFEIYKKSLL